MLIVSETRATDPKVIPKIKAVSLLVSSYSLGNYLSITIKVTYLPTRSWSYNYNYCYPYYRNLLVVGSYCTKLIWISRFIS